MDSRESVQDLERGSDTDWGRVAGAAPPISPRTPLLFALIGGGALVAVVLLLIRLPGPLDERTLADQRNGLVANGPRVPAQVRGVQFGGRAVVLLFQRTAPAPGRLRSWLDGLPSGTTVRVVVAAPPGQVPGTLAGVPVVADPEQQLAAAVDLPASRDGGPGVGYAIVDSSRITRYATLDPSWAGNAFEVATILGAVR